MEEPGFGTLNVQFHMLLTKGTAFLNINQQNKNVGLSYMTTNSNKNFKLNL